MLRCEFLLAKLRRVDFVLSRLSDTERAEVFRSARAAGVELPHQNESCASTPAVAARRDTPRALMETEVYAASSGERKKIEAPFGEARSILSMVRLRLRGMTGAGDEFLLTAAAAHDGLIHAAKPHPTGLIILNRLSITLRRKDHVRFYQ